ncbi:hypothetical protein HFN89_01395 [Rhizobium laguerreae]|nr:hypothetical protein [Rhizobium laguerreae]
MSETTAAAVTRLSPELRKQIRYVIDRSFSEGPSTADGLFADIVDLLEAPFVARPQTERPASSLMKALETLGAKAVGQVEYWRRKQMEYPGLEDFYDGDGFLQLPDEIGPLLSGNSANGRYSEADWWLSSIREVAREVATSEAVERSGGDLKAFAKTMIDCAFEGGDADGGFIQEKAVEFGLLRETVFDSEVHKDQNGWARNGEQWFVHTDALSDFGAAALELSGNDDLRMIDHLRRVIPTMGKSSWEVQNSRWDFEARGEQGESLIFREASADMIPFSTRTAVCRAPKLMDGERWEPIARYIKAACPAAVSALMKAHDALSWQLKRLTAERNDKDLLLPASEERIAEERDRADVAERRLAAVPEEVVLVKPLQWLPDPELPDALKADSIFPGAYGIRQVCDAVEPMWKLILPCDGEPVYDTPEAAQAAAQADYESRVGPALGAAAFPQGWQLVPKEPYPEVVGAWWRYKNGFHYHDEPEPEDTSDYGAYRAMLAAMPVYHWPDIRAVEGHSAKGVDAALSKIAEDQPALVRRAAT